MTLPIADRATVRRALATLIRADGRATAGVLLLSSLAAAAGLGAPWLLGIVVNNVATGTTTSTVDALTLAILGFALIQLVLTRFARYAAHRIGERALAGLREDLIDHTLKLPTALVEQAGTGDLVTRGTTDVAAVGTTLRDAVPEVFLATVQILFLFGAVFLLDPLLGLTALTGFPVMLLVTRWYLTRARDAYLAEGAANSALAEGLAATAEGARTIEAFDLGDRRVTAGLHTIEGARAARTRTLYLRSVLFPGLDIAYAIPTVVALLAGGALYFTGHATLGAVVTTSLYLRQLIDPLDRILMQLDQLQLGSASLARIKGVHATTEPPTATAPEAPIEVRGLRYAYPGHPDVLTGIDLTIEPGEKLALVGPSGAGKSTLGRLLAGVDHPRTGAITIGGVPVSALAPGEIVLVTQDHHVFLGTLRDNLLIAAPDADDHTLLDALATVRAHWADDLTTTLGPDGRALDAAQAQQLALARVVLADPHTVILDEATALLDPTTARHTERALAAVLKGRTVIAIAHRLHTAHDADRVAIIDHGRITELGSHHHLLARDGTYAALWASWHGHTG
ncbi:ABC transporter ATP-binding protein [Amycolatopsis sp. NPDC059657]|uniref:ABC transporter ATP-binding protein n=1 Tax=Amycolatopsis sp. NPDC059657 TaxID=3346899 RepID=UPI00366D75D8